MFNPFPLMRRIPMLRLLAILAFALSSVAAAEEFAIDQFTFAWTVDSIGDNQLMVVKDDNKTVVRVWDAKDPATMTPDDAVSVGKTLKRTDEVWKKLLNKPMDETETVKISDKLNVVFFKSKAGFFVSLEQGDGTVLLDRKAANRFAPHLLKSVEMAKFVDEKIKP